MQATVFNIHDVILLMTAFLCLLFALLLLSIDSNHRRSNFFLALFLLQQAAIPLDILISFGSEFRQITLDFSPDLFYVFGFGYWLEAPLLLWYVRSLIFRDYRLQTRDLIYIVPFGLYLIHQIVFYYSLGASWRASELANYDISSTPSYIHWITLSREIFRVGLGILCLIELKHYRSRLKSQYADVEKDELSWLSILIIGFTALRFWAVLVLVFVILNIVFQIKLDFELMGLIGNYTAFLLISLLLFFSLGHASIHEGVERDTGPNETNTEYLNPELKARLVKSLEAERIYLKSNLTLDRLAEHLSMTPKVLSGVINRQLNCNFFELINTYRIKEAKELLVSKPDMTVMSVIFEAGFNSKATFNTIFKRKVGLTPTQFREQRKLED